MMTLRLYLKKGGKQGHIRIKYDLEKLEDPDVGEAFHAKIGGRFALLALLYADDTDIGTLMDNFNTAVTETACETLGKYRFTKKPWVS